MKRLFAVTVVGLALLALPPFVLSMGFGFARPKTLREDASESKLIIYGMMDNPRRGPNGDTTDCIVVGVIKSHPLLAGKKVLTLPRYIEVADRNRPPRLLLFCDLVEKGKLDFFRATSAQPAVVDYLKGILAIDGKDVAKRLRYCFDFLDNADPDIAGDALLEFTKSTRPELRQAAAKLPPAKLRRWLRDPKTRHVEQPLYAFLLGHCGNVDDAILLRSLATRLTKEKSAYIDGILIGYVYLQPKTGWAYLRGVLANPGLDFSLRLGALRAAGYFYETQPGVKSRQAVVEALVPALKQRDIADLVIEALRRWKHWESRHRILALWKQPTLDGSLIRRAIIRYCLQCPCREAAAFIVDRRNTDGGLTADLKEILRLESEFDSQ